MESRPLEITAVHAKDLKDVNFMSKMDVYVVVSLSAGDYTKRRTSVDKDGGTSPNWNNLSLTFVLDVAAADQNRLTLDFLLRSDRVLGDRDIGEVHVPVKELLENFGDEKIKVVSYQVRTPSGRPQGTLNFSYKMGNTFTSPAPVNPKNLAAGEPAMAYPLPPAANPPSSYPPPPPGAYYPPQYPPPGAYPPQAAYGYPPQQQGYGYAPPPPQQGYGYPAPPPPRKNKSKMGMGMGLGAGLLGGLVLGEMASDIGDMASYDDDSFDF